MNFKKELGGLVKNACNPGKFLYALSNNRGYGGFHLVDIKKIKSRRGLAFLGKGVQGRIYIGCMDKECKKMVAIKVAEDGLKHEYKVMMKIYQLTPHVPTPFIFSNCLKKQFLYTEYANGGDLLSALTRYPMTQDQLRTIVFQVLYSLYALHKEFPDFRHNDLHLKNVLLDLNFLKTGRTMYKFKLHTGSANDFRVPNTGLRALIADFGWSNMKGDQLKDVMSKDYAKSDGIAPDNHFMYDAHLFLSSLYREVRTETHPAFKSFIKNNFPSEYLSKVSSKVFNFRMRYGVDHSKLPTFEKLLSEMYFKPFRSLPLNTNANITNRVPRKLTVSNNTKQFLVKMVNRKPKVASPPKPSKNAKIFINALIARKPKVPTPPPQKPKTPSPQ